MFKLLFCFTYVLVMTDVAICKPDYVYKASANGWFRLHRKPTTFRKAVFKCHHEGAVLASQINDDVADVIETMLQDPTLSVPLDITALNSFDNVFGKLEKCSTKSAKQVNPNECTRRLPFICYKKQGDSSSSVLNECGTFDDEYKLNNMTGSCYKLHSDRQNWSGAQRVCSAEGGYLVIINNREEADVIKDMTQERPVQISATDELEPLFVGLFDWDKNGTWITVHGDRLENVFDGWAEGEPNNDQGQYCGSLLKRGALADVSCHSEAMFMCEKDPSPIIKKSFLELEVSYRGSRILDGGTNEA